MRLQPSAFSVETWDGISLGPLECPSAYTWSRELSEVSNLSLSAPRQELTDQIIPWLHWVSVWNGQALQWRGPIQDVQFDNAGMTITAKDVATFMWRTRTVTTKSWSSLDIASIAADMWRDMLQLHNITAEPLVLPALSGMGRYNVSIKADVRMLNQEMSDLAKLGLRWTVIKGRPVIGTQPTGIAAELGECHLSAGAKIQRSGARTSNDVRVQGKNYSHTERVELGGLHLQTIVSIDDVFGVSNITAAAREQALKRGVIKNILVIPSSGTLSADAPVELDTLVPGVRLSVTALGMQSVFELQKVEVAGSSSGATVAITMTVIDDSTELESAG
jgi:hypothetical protein